jgi:beta-lactamase regulating signal transducer with metallopeptidase domain
MTPREDELFNVIFHLIQVIKNYNPKYNIQWASYHLLRSTQGMFEDQDYVNYIHNEFRKVEEQFNE